MGIDEAFDETANLRPSAGCFVGDSGALSYCGTGKKSNPKGLRDMLAYPAEQLKYPWGKATIHSSSGWTAKDMTVVVKSYVETHTHLMTPDGNGGELFPTHMP
eukprot:2279932-Heterocapsa_arctica.AAC.1